MVLCGKVVRSWHGKCENGAREVFYCKQSALVIVSLYHNILYFCGAHYILFNLIVRYVFTYVLRKMMIVSK